MALASFGTDRFYREVREDVLELLDDGGFELRQRATGNGLVYLDEMVEFCPPRERGGPLDPGSLRRRVELPGAGRGDHRAPRGGVA